MLRINKIEEDVNLVNKNILKSSNKIYSLYQNYFLNNYKHFVLLNKQDDDTLSRNRRTNHPIQYASSRKEPSLKKDSFSVKKLLLNSPYSKNQKWKKQVSKTKLNNQMLNKMNIQICSLTELIPNLKNKKEEAKFRLYEMNDFYFHQKKKPFKM